jgi:hypothetical protein
MEDQPTCPNCGALAGAPPAHAATQRLRDDGQPPDPAGIGRYILSFLLAGIVGLAIQHWTRDYGWRGVMINMAIFVFSVLAIVSTVAATAGSA